MYKQQLQILTSQGLQDFAAGGKTVFPWKKQPWQK